MIRKRPLFVLLCLLLILCLTQVGGCAFGPEWMRMDAQGRNDLSRERYSQKAIDLEEQGELRQALFAWRVAAALDPEDIRITDTIRTLQQKIAAAAGAHYQQGVESYHKGDFINAHRMFLKVIHLAPNHQRAHNYLKNRLHATAHATYRVQRGDSFTKIANDIYKDVSKAYLIAYYNDLDPHRPLYIDTLLVLPELAPSQLLPRRDLLALMDQAQKALNENRYAEVLSITDRINAQSPGNVQAQRLADTARFNMARALMEKKNFHAALKQLQQIGPAFKGRDKALLTTHRELSRQATDEKLRMARECLDDGTYTSAIRICEEILSKTPSHGVAREILDAAHYALGKQHLDQGRESMAIDVLSVLDRSYQDTARLLTQAYARLNARAEGLYRKGVMHFLNEELELAIDAWGASLALNPNHPKARQDIDNARRLLDKWQAMVNANGPKP